jgi:hypothetical protein
MMQTTTRKDSTSEHCAARALYTAYTVYSVYQVYMQCLLTFGDELAVHLMVPAHAGAEQRVGLVNEHHAGLQLARQREQRLGQAGGLAHVHAQQHGGDDVQQRHPHVPAQGAH